MCNSGLCLDYAGRPIFHRVVSVVTDPVPLCFSPGVYANSVDSPSAPPLPSPSRRDSSVGSEQQVRLR